MNNRRIGKAMMLMGLLLIAAALCLSAYNLAQESNAGKESERIMTEMLGIIGPRGAQSDAAVEEIVVLSEGILPPENTPVPQGLLPSYIEEEAAAEGGGMELPAGAETTAPKEPAEEPLTENTASPAQGIQMAGETAAPTEGAERKNAPPSEQETKTAAAPSAAKTPRPASKPTAAPTPTPRRPAMTLAPAAAQPTHAQERRTETPEPTETPFEAPVSKGDARPEEDERAAYEAADTAAPIPDYILHPEIEMPEIEIDGDAYIGTIELPSLELLLPVMSEWSYPLLKKAPCRYFGSAYMGNMVIIAHNYGTHFGHIKELRVDDPVIFTDVEGHVFHYEVVETEILQPDDVIPLVDSDYPLTLLTCAIGGRTRITVRCEWAGKERWKENSLFIRRRMTR